MNSDGTLTALLSAYQTKQTEYSVAGLGIPGLRHFVYKSRTQVQITQPVFEDPYDQPQARKRSAYVSLCFFLLTGSNRIATLYQIIYDSIHAKSGQQAGLKLQYIRTNNESVMGWVKHLQPY